MRVDDFKINKTDLVPNEAAMVRGDQRYVLYKKVSNVEQKEALGHYLGVRRKNDSTEASVIIYYRKSSAGSQVFSDSSDLTVGEKKHIFKFIGNEFENEEKLVSWRIDLVENGEIISSEQSYLWE